VARRDAASFWRWPGTLAPGDVSAMAAHVDLFPTLAEIAGAKFPPAVAQQVEGRSLVPLLKDPRAAWPDRTLVTHVGRWERGQAVTAKYGNCAIRNARWSLVSVARDGAKAWQLFDLQADPGQQTNCAVQHPEVVRQLDAAYEVWWESILPCLENEHATGPVVNPFKKLYWQQFGREE
jgi:arylsulfatase A-like enzyme